MGCDGLTIKSSALQPCFNPRTRVGCDLRRSLQATLSYGFNPRTRVGCDGSATVIRGSSMFQSTHPCGVRQVSFELSNPVDFVSIHAPVWGATVWSLVCARNMGRFNPRTRVGCDLAATWDFRSGTFQSTHPCGVRPSIRVDSFSLSCFNPRTRVGCDHRTCYYLQPIKRFNPRTRVGCDLVTRLIVSNRLFQSTHPCGVRRSN